MPRIPRRETVASDERHLAELRSPPPPDRDVPAALSALARLAYEAYEAEAWGREPVPWTEMPRKARDAWAAAVRAVVLARAEPIASLIERSSLAHDRLYAECPRCRREVARDPFDGTCVRCRGPLAEAPR